MTTNNQYKFSVRASVFPDYKVSLLKGIATCAGEPLRVLIGNPPTMWGQLPAVSVLTSETHSLPGQLELEWHAESEDRDYELLLDLGTFTAQANKLFSQRVADGSALFDCYIVGFAPLGHVSLWLSGPLRSVLLCQANGHHVSHSALAGRSLSAQSVTMFMRQYRYRYLLRFEHWDEQRSAWTGLGEHEAEPQLTAFAEKLSDGTFDKLNDGRLFGYHDAGMPLKLAVGLSSARMENGMPGTAKREYALYFWFEAEELCRLFSRFYGAHPDTMADLMLRLDLLQNHYELSLGRSGLREPFVISANAYQLLVFRNDFECYRSSNYRQERGAWRW